MEGIYKRKSFPSKRLKYSNLTLACAFYFSEMQPLLRRIRILFQKQLSSNSLLVFIQQGRVVQRDDPLCCWMFFFTPRHKTSVGQYGVIDNAANQYLIRKPKGFCLSRNDAELGQARNGIDLNDGATLTWNEHHVHTRQSAASH